MHKTSLTYISITSWYEPNDVNWIRCVMTNNLFRYYNKHLNREHCDVIRFLMNIFPCSSKNSNASGTYNIVVWTIVVWYSNYYTHWSSRIGSSFIPIFVLFVVFCKRTRISFVPIFCSLGMSCDLGYLNASCNIHKMACPR